VAATPGCSAARVGEEGVEEGGVRHAGASVTSTGGRQLSDQPLAISEPEP